MRRIRFHSAADLAEALQLKAAYREDGLILAGGTDLIMALRGQSASLPPVQVIDISRVAELQGWSNVVKGDGGTGTTGGADEPWLCLGPLLTHRAIESDSALARPARPLAQACSEIGSPQIRNRGTLGGNIVNASACADTVPALLALGAELRLGSTRGERRVPVEEATLRPYQTCLAPDEILLEVQIPPLREDSGASFIKLGRRRALSIARMSIAVVLRRTNGGVIGEARIAAGSVAPVPRRFPQVEALLRGETPSPDLFSAAGDRFAAAMIEITGRRWSTPYKEPVASKLLRRALSAALEGGNR